MKKKSELEKIENRKLAQKKYYENKKDKNYVPRKKTLERKMFIAMLQQLDKSKV
jgi:hypothetical protein